MPLAISFLGMLLLALSSGAIADPLQIFTWREDTAKELPGSVALVWARINRGDAPDAPGADAESARPAKSVADEVATELKTRKASDRAVFLWHGGTVHGTADQPELYPDARLAEAYARSGFREFTRGWMSDFWRQLALSKSEPSLIVLDYEKAGGFWGLNSFATDDAGPVRKPERVIGRLIAMERLQAMLGHSPTGFQPTDYLDVATGSWNRRAVSAFNVWQLARRAEALRMTIFEPAERIFGHEIPGSNYGEQKRAWNGVDLNGWPTQSGDLSGTLSSPDTYLGIQGQRYELLSDKTLAYKRALQWIDKHNEVRAALAAGSPTAPWYSNPDYGRDAEQSPLEHRLQWAAGLLHDRLAGVNIMLFWSAAPWSDDEAAFANKIIDGLRTLNPKAAHLAALSELDPQSAMAPWLNLARTILSDSRSEAAIPAANHTAWSAR